MEPVPKHAACDATETSANAKRLSSFFIMMILCVEKNGVSRNPCAQKQVNAANPNKCLLFSSVFSSAFVGNLFGIKFDTNLMGF
jgi:hypothetical protein